MVSGQAAGALIGALLSPIAVVKYHMWGQDDKTRTVMGTARKMLRERGSSRVFFRGFYATILRDAAFGGVFALLRWQHADKTGGTSFSSSAFAAAIATIVSSPFNYARNVQFDTPAKARSLSVFAALRHLTTRVGQKVGVLEKASYVQNRLRLGWGTLRVSSGMALTSELYESCKAPAAIGEPDA
jgi:hypothetical protein